MLVGQGLVVVGVYFKIARARVGLGCCRVVRAEAPAVGAPATASRRRTVHRTPGARVGEYHMTNAGFSDATTVAAHDSASASITPPADSRLASNKAWHCVVRRRTMSSRAPREGIGAGGWLVEMVAAPDHRWFSRKGLRKNRTRGWRKQVVAQK